MAYSSPVLASQYARSRPKHHEEETLSTPAPTGELTQPSGDQDPRQRQSAPQVPFSNEALHLQGSHHEPIEELSDSRKGAGLSSQHAVNSPATSSESSPLYQDFPPRTSEGRRVPAASRLSGLAADLQPDGWTQHQEWGRLPSKSVECGSHVSRLSAKPPMT